MKANLMERFAADAVKEGLVDALYTPIDSPIGKLLVVVSDKGVCRVGFDYERSDSSLAEVADRLGPRVLRSDVETATYRDAFEAYFDGATEELTLPYDLSLVTSPFRRQVLLKLAKVPHGSLVTYGDLARKAGRPNAYRAAGTACATNPVPLVVPCHRVVPSSGGIGNYGGGVERKEFLLHLEGVLKD